MFDLKSVCKRIRLMKEHCIAHSLALKILQQCFSSHFVRSWPPNGYPFTAVKGLSKISRKLQTLIMIIHTQTYVRRRTARSLSTGSVWKGTFDDPQYIAFLFFRFLVRNNRYRPPILKHTQNSYRGILWSFHHSFRPQSNRSTRLRWCKGAHVTVKVCACAMKRVAWLAGVCCVCVWD